MQLNAFMTVGLVAITAFGLVFRFVGLDYSFSFDEAYLAAAAELPWPDLLALFRFEADHTPLYYVLTKLWGTTFGFSDLSLRLLAALSGAGAVVAIGYAARTFWGRTAGLVALALSSVSSILFFWTRTARMYALLVALAALSLAAGWRWLKQPSTRSAAWYVVVSLLAVATHLTAAAVVFAQFVFLVLARSRRPAWRSVIITFGLMAAVLVPWFAYNSLPRYFEPLGLPTWVTDSVNPLAGATAVIRDSIVFYHGIHTFTYQWEINAFIVFRVLTWAVTLGALATALVTLLRRQSKETEYRHATGYVLTVVLISLLPVIVVRPATKFFLPAAVGLLLLATDGLRRWHDRTRLGFLAAVGILTVFAALQLPAMVRGQGLPWRGAAEYIAAHERAGDTVLVHLWPDELTVSRYYRGQNKVQGVFPLSVEEQNRIFTYARYNAARVITDDNLGPWLEQAPAGRQRAWLVYGTGEPFFNGQIILSWFDRRGWTIRDRPSIPYGRDGFLLLLERG
ncbi:MAG: glycosyltransferase family 39 protein [Candidatus Kerfeldbacteria bacterium]|nr:glycosyltransferase family 39 protein [Candidatus Kerfeldbacteria bacterium]